MRESARSTSARSAWLPQPADGRSGSGLAGAPPLARGPGDPCLSLFAFHQTLVQTVITDDDSERRQRRRLRHDDLGAGRLRRRRPLHEVFTGLWLSVRIGGRYTLCLESPRIRLWVISCVGRPKGLSLAVGRFVDGFGKLMVMAVGRATLYKQFDRALLIVAIGFYGVFAYSTRLLDAAADGRNQRSVSPGNGCTGSMCRSRCWRWGWSGGAHPSGPTAPGRYTCPSTGWPSRLFVAWFVAITFAFSWFLANGSGWTSDAFAATVCLCLLLPVALVGWIASGLSPGRSF